MKNTQKKQNNDKLLNLLDKCESYLKYTPLADFEGWQNIYPRYISREDKDGRIYDMICFTLSKDVDARQTEYKVLLTASISSMILNKVFTNEQLEPYKKGNKMPLISNALLQAIKEQKQDFHFLAFVGKTEKGFITLLDDDRDSKKDALDFADSLTEFR